MELPASPAPLDIVAGPDFTPGTRADRFLADAVGTVSRSRVKAMIEGGHVSLNGQVLREPAHPIRPGDRLRVELPPVAPAAPAPQPVPFTILHEDADLIVLDKPAGLVVHPAPGNQDGTLVNGLLAHCGEELPGIGGERRPGIVHRLDKDTSGVMVVAKTEMALAALSAAFAARDLDRSYVALCWGVPAEMSGSIEGDIGRDPRDRKRMAVVPRNGKHALTHYKVQQVWAGALALLTCKLATGRTHQIRVHLASAGHPLVGDPVYLRRVPAAARLVAPQTRAALLDFPRQALHAARLGFHHPRTGEALLFEAAMPSDLADLIASLNAG